MQNRLFATLPSQPQRTLLLLRRILLAACCAGAGLMAGCATTKSVSPTAFDLGSLPAAAIRAGVQPAPPGPITVADVVTAPWLDSQQMHYRLSYDNDQQPRPYANSRWSMAPPELLGQRIKARMAQAGGTVLSPVDGAINLPLLRLEADDFSQRFTSAAQSDVHVSIRASVLNGRVLVGQKTFDQVRAAPTPDAAGGASALAAATDVLIADLMAWLATLPLKK